jgi:endonuclease/exonuclease/phosphatase family metal-dependent hydrolase
MPARGYRIMSYNVRYFGHALRGLASTRRSKRRIAQALAALDPAPDIVCLQEVDTISVRSSVAYRRAHPEETQLESFMSELERAFAERGGQSPYDAYYFRAHAYKLRRTPLYTTGLAVLVDPRRLRVEGHNALAPKHITHHHVERWRDVKQTRICAHIELYAGGQRFHVFNTHLSLPTPFAREFWKRGSKMGFGKNQLHEARALVGFIRVRAKDEPFLLCGDFNSSPGSPVFEFLTGEAGITCAQLALGHIDGATPRAFPTAGLMRLRMHLDHLFSGNGVDWLDLDGTARYGDRGAPFYRLSDHVPMIGRFKL